MNNGFAALELILPTIGMIALSAMLLIIVLIGFIMLVKMLLEKDIRDKILNLCRARVDLQTFKEKYSDEIVEYYQSKKKKKQELPMTGLSPVMPDKEKGIDTFNKNASPDISSETGGEVSGGAGE